MKTKIKNKYLAKISRSFLTCNNYYVGDRFIENASLLRGRRKTHAIFLFAQSNLSFALNFYIEQLSMKIENRILPFIFMIIA